MGVLGFGCGFGFDLKKGQPQLERIPRTIQYKYRSFIHSLVQSMNVYVASIDNTELFRTF